MTSFASTFEIEQKVNRCHRRCVIGKVKWKQPGYNPKIGLTGQPIVPMTTPSFSPLWGREPRWWEYPAIGQASQAKCSCKPGIVCMNVACPHLPVVTC